VVANRRALQKRAEMLVAIDKQGGAAIELQVCVR